VKISIKDHGPGIKPELLPKIFEPYFTTKKGGSGLGLATVYSVVKKHEGLIKVDSKIGEGTTFEIFLRATDKPIATSQAKPIDPNFSGTGRLLIMDDDVSVLKILAAVLRKFGFEVETAADGTEAIKRYADAKSAGHPFDVVVMDLTIPNGVGGREAIKQLREIDPAVKAIVSSGYSLDPVMANYRESGFVGIIPKPYRTEELLHILQEVLAKK
jgi:CheY-like chemotaxis protein